MELPDSTNSMMIRNREDKPIPKKRGYQLPIIRLAFVILMAVGIYLVIDYTGPSSIELKPGTFFGIPSLHAKELIVQEYDNDGNLWATRGKIIYRLEKGSNKFMKVTHVPTGLNHYWLRNFKVIRRLTLRPECIEVLVTDKGDICAFSAGRMWVLKVGEKRFVEIHQLSDYGFGNRGIMPSGLIDINDSTIYYGEYFQNHNRRAIQIFKSVNNLSSFEIRHIHAIQQDPYSKKLWVCTGDEDEESMLAWSIDGFRSINQLGRGSQLWRICQLVFTENSIYWGTDTGDEEIAGIYRWSKNHSTLEKIEKIDGRIFFGTRLAKGTIVMSTNREGGSNEKDLKTRLYVLPDDSTILNLTCGTWNKSHPVIRPPFAKLRLQRNQGGPSIVITCLNQKEIRDGDLFIISEDDLVEAAYKRVGMIRHVTNPAIPPFNTLSTSLHPSTQHVFAEVSENRNYEHGEADCTNSSQSIDAPVGREK
jgi:hypothetical protein